ARRWRTGRATTSASWRRNDERSLLVLAHAHVAERDRPVIALEQQRPLGRFWLRVIVTRRRLHLDVLVNGFTVERHIPQIRVFGLLAVLVEARREEDGRQLLPLAGRLAGVLLWRDALVEVLVRREQRRARVDASAVVAGQVLVFFPVAVQDLDLVQRVE